MVDDEKKFTQSDVDRIVSERLARDRQTRSATLDSDSKLSALVSKVDELQNELKLERDKNRADSINVIRDKVASELKVPPGLIPFIQGSDESAIKLSAESLVKAIGPAQSIGGATSPPIVDATKRQYTRAELSSMSATDINKDWENIQTQLKAGSIK